MFKTQCKIDCEHLLTMLKPPISLDYHTLYHSFHSINFLLYKPLSAYSKKKLNSVYKYLFHYSFRWIINSLFPPKVGKCILLLQRESADTKATITWVYVSNKDIVLENGPWKCSWCRTKRESDFPLSWSVYFNNKILLHFAIDLSERTSLSRHVAPLSYLIIERRLRGQVDLFVPFVSLSPGNNTCFSGKCYYCRESEPACAEGEIMEGSLTLWLPDVWPLQKHRHPWGRTYREGKLARYESKNEFWSGKILWLFLLMFIWRKCCCAAQREHSGGF